MEAPASERPQLKFVIVGHVDHGKSTLVGRLLYDTESLPPSKLEEIRKASEELGYEVELSYVIDHLEEERSRRITIDTAQTWFKTPEREYVIIDAPGHREFIRNMVTGASQADAAVFIVDAQEGIREQTRRHAYVLGMLGIQQVLVLMNKMDLVNWQKARFDELNEELSGFFASIGIRALGSIPVSAKLGDNVARPSKNMPWYTGPTLLDSLARLQLTARPDNLPLRFPVQDRYTIDGRAIIVGRIEAGKVRAGQEVVFVPSGQKARVATVEMFLRDRTEAEAGESIGLTLEGDPAIERGQVACPVDAPATVGSRLSASIFWLSDTPFRSGETLRLRCATQQVGCSIERIERLTDSSTLELIAENAQSISATQVGHVILRTDRPIAAEPFAAMPSLGRFVLMRGHDVEAGGIVQRIES